MKIRLLHLGDTLLIGFIFMIASVCYLQNETSFYIRVILVVGMLIVWLIIGGIAYGFIRVLGKKIPDAESLMEREYDERAQMLNTKARNYAGRVLQILLVILAISIFIISNEMLISLLLFVLCGLYDLLAWIIRKIIEN